MTTAGIDKAAASSSNSNNSRNGQFYQPKGHSMQSAEPSRAPTESPLAKTTETTVSQSAFQVQVVSFTPLAPFYAKWSVTSADAFVLVAITLVAFIVRCYKLSVPSQVVFDEVHFGKFAGKYLNGTYFYDLHPPLAKMMFAAAGKMAGYDGMFDFKSIGLDYVAAGVPYVGMRLMPAVLGAITVPATYVTARACGYGLDTSVLASVLVCFENGLIAQSRLILLDSPLVFFTVMSLAAWAMFWTKQEMPFTRSWWFWLISTGTLMGCAASCKWVGLFLFPAIGLSTIVDLWDKIADRSLTPSRWLMHFMARAFGLIIVPLVVYLFWFQVHFALLYKTSDSAGMMSAEFQTTLAGGLNITTDRDVFYGSEIRIKSTNARSGYLHSHSHAWQHAKGSGQQQITIYGHADQNNIWVIEPAFNTTVDTSNGPVAVAGGSVVRLRHKITGKYLHSHDKRPALSSQETKFELSGYGFDNFPGDSNDNFRLEILSGDKNEPGSDKHVQAIYTRFRLIHTNLHCAVYNSQKKLPKWAFEQIEANCMRNCMPRMSTWHVEYARLPGTEATGIVPPQASYRKLSLWGKILEYNRLMADSNGSINGDHPFAARPQHWPWLRRGTAYWGGHGNIIYQLGNPLIWWGSLSSILLFVLVRSLLFVLNKRRIRPMLLGQRAKYFSATGFFVVSWACHYVPFFLMGRELFVHHYFPALWMAILVLAFTLDLFTAGVPRVVRLSVYAAVAAAVLHAFVVFSHITYARIWTKDACLKAKWLRTWDFDCEHAIGGIRSTKPSLSSSLGESKLDDNVNGESKPKVNAPPANSNSSVDLGDVDDAVPNDGVPVPVPEIGDAYVEEFNPEKKLEQETSDEAAAAAAAVVNKQIKAQPKKLQDPTAIKANNHASPIQVPESVAGNLGEKSDHPATGANQNENGGDEDAAKDKHIEL
ncbi:Dolichyl-phosphate-mannose--protein mannosyltransferase 1 [Coemansia asiatica]|uniref:Dolichyl-phosphate-mannose--protein mannosyltransferase n=1 Tax=Coemansia asiatica TaxID=1052880 RepID=A0A9W8CGI4_9FUNG|nr:Dolichyl-phosphate-mannose--protein mannosyltransferase 1 [Coemansia asiatica]